MTTDDAMSNDDFLDRLGEAAEVAAMVPAHRSHRSHRLRQAAADGTFSPAVVAALTERGVQPSNPLAPVRVRP
jgi:hypothetical protein